MCVGVPMQVLSVDGIAARATDGREEALIDLSLTGPVAVGDWILTFLGAAREIITEDEARKITAALDGHRSPADALAASREWMVEEPCNGFWHGRAGVEQYVAA